MGIGEGQALRREAWGRDTLPERGQKKKRRFRKRSFPKKKNKNPLRNLRGRTRELKGMNAAPYWWFIEKRENGALRETAGQKERRGPSVKPWKEKGPPRKKKILFRIEKRPPARGERPGADNGRKTAAIRGVAIAAANF